MAIREYVMYQKQAIQMVESDDYSIQIVGEDPNLAEGMCRVRINEDTGHGVLVYGTRPMPDTEFLLLKIKYEEEKFERESRERERRSFERVYMKVLKELLSQYERSREVKVTKRDQKILWKAHKLGYKVPRIVLEAAFPETFKKKKQSFKKKQDTRESLKKQIVGIKQRIQKLRDRYPKEQNDQMKEKIMKEIITLQKHLKKLRAQLARMNQRPSNHK